MTHITLMKNLKVLSLVTLVVFLQACVTTTTGTNSKEGTQQAVEANVQLGMTYLQKGDRENALRAFSNALKKDKKSAEAHQGIAIIHQENGEIERAEKSFKKALKGRADFSQPGVYLSYGRFLYSQKRNEEAIKYFDLATQDITYVSRANAFYFLGLTHNKLGNTLRAKASFERALNLKENFAEAAIELSQIAYTEKDYAAAQRYLARFVAANKRPTARSLWLSIQIERIFENEDKEASSALALKNLYPYSKEYLLYKKSLKAVDE